MTSYKVAVIGGGPGGYTTAIRLNQYDIKTIVFEKQRLGGVCLNWGCIPTKALVKIADMFADIKAHEKMGTLLSDSQIQYSKAVEYKSNVVEKLVGGIEFLFKKREIPVVNQCVTQISQQDGAYLIKTGDEEYLAEYVVIATGSKPKQLPNIAFDGEKILSSKQILSMNELPKTLAVIGGGVIGCEFASIFQQLGVKVTIIEFLPDLIALEDKEVSKRLLTTLKKKRIKIYNKTAVESAETTENGVTLHLSNKKSLEVEKVLMSVGRAPQCDIEFQGMDLEKFKNFVTIDEQMRTSIKNIFAIGDITGKLMLAHTASKQGMMVAENIYNEINNNEHHPKALNYQNIPRCTFTNPNVASVGLTEAEAEEKYGKIETGKFMFSANGKALAGGHADGFVKVVVEADTGILRGMHIIGPEAAELIAQGAIMIGLNADMKMIKDIVFAHPTLSESVGEALEDVHNFSIHQL